MLRARLGWRLTCALALIGAAAFGWGVAAGRREWPIALAALGPLAAAGLAAYWIARQWSGALAHLTRGVRGLAQGQGGETPEGGARAVWTEFEPLARACHALAEQLADRVELISAERGKLVTILANMVEGVVAVDTQERVLHINEAAAAILGADTGIVGRPLWEATRLIEVTTALRAALKDEREVSAELRLLGPPRDRRVDFVAHRLRDGAGRLVGAVAVLHDVTELRRLEAVRRDFVSNLSHELKTPIAAVRAMAETLVEDTAMDSGTRSRFTRRILEQAERLSALVTDLLTLARAEAPAATAEWQEVDLRELAQATVRGFESTAEARQIQVIATLPEACVIVRGDPESLRQALDNLVDNALKYTPAGGHVWLSLETQARRARCAVRDDGIGIGAIHRERIFERFYRVDKARSRELGGTGLGLAIVKHVCQLHGGEVEVTSEPGRGSTFTLSLPLADPTRSTSGAGPRRRAQ